MFSYSEISLRLIANWRFPCIHIYSAPAGVFEGQTGKKCNTPTVVWLAGWLMPVSAYIFNKKVLLLCKSRLLALSRLASSEPSR